MQHHGLCGFADQRTFLCEQHDLRHISQNKPMLNHKSLVHVQEHLHQHSKYLRMIEDYESYKLAFTSSTDL